MTTSLLAYIPSPAQGVWHLGPVPIRAYALCIITGIIAALIIGDRRWVARGGEQGVIYDIALWTVPFGLIGGRLYHLMTDWRTYFAEGGAGISGAVRIWDGGLGIWGAVALGGVGAWIGCRRHGIPLPAFADAIAPGVILAQAIGRLGNYFNQELYGRPTDLPWGLEIFQRSDGSGVVNPHLLNGVSTGQVYEVVHPTFLYELLWNLLVFFLLLWADRRFKLGHGRLFALYVAAYCVGRFGVELMRSDTATLIAGIRVNSFTSTFVFIGAVVYMMVAPRGREDPATLGGRHADEAEAEAEVDVEAEGAVLAVPVAVAAGAAVGGGDDAEEVADEADAVETQPDETVALAEQAVDLDESADEAESDEDAAEAADTEEPGDEAEDAVDEDAVDAEAAVEESVDESVEKPVDSDEVEDEDESDTEAEELAVDEDEPAEEADEDVADETGVVDPDAETAESDDSDAAESEDAAVEEDVVAEDDAAEAEDEAADVADEPAADESAAETTESEESADEAEGNTDEEPEVDADGEDDADEAEEVADETDEEADSDDEPADEPVEEVEPKVAATEKVEPVGVPVWEPPAPRRRWWRRQG
ncbi:prolipoprotein diacylglyceryl transferase [Mycobacterium sp. PDNC021]|uniref:prolipoprotein diacylglyceryl transferase n=1 Tax=Mycobacterium sp. PDNC021 TaxID=3391399 RepID=UPI003AB0FD44